MQTIRFLENQVAIITGSGYGIGQGIALEFARQGAQIVVSDLDPQRSAATQKLVRQLGGESQSVNGDITDDKVRQTLLQKATGDFGGIDILVNNVGIGNDSPSFLKSEPQQWKKVWQTNFLAGTLLAHGVAREMIATGRQGKIIFITSVHQERIFGAPIYSTTKAALKMLVEELGAELAPHGIRVNGIAPGWIDTSPEAVSKHKPGSHLETPLGRGGLPEEVGRAAVFLASDYWSSYITATTILVDGGLHTFSWRTLKFSPQPGKA